MKSRPRIISLKIKIAAVLAAVFIFVGSLAGFFVWRELNGKVREISRQKLVSIARTTAALIDADEHEKISDGYSENYQNISRILSKAVDSNPEVDDIYTLRKTDKEDIWYFVASAYETSDKDGDGKISPEEKKVEYGEKFDVSGLPEMKKAFETSSVDREINCDSWGCWLSGYAPIVDSSGKAVAVLGVDISAQDIIYYERSSFRMIFSVFLFLFISFCLVIFLAFRIISRPAIKIIAGINDFGRDISSRMKIETGDEFEMIAESFNMMANEFQRKLQKEGKEEAGKKKISFKTDKKKVLIIEDEEKLQSSLKSNFENSEFEVLAVSDGLEGLEKALELRPHLIIIDLLVPKLEGVEFLKKIRKNVWGANVSIIVLANIANYKKLEEALELGVDEYIIKTDWNMKDIVKRSRAVLGIE